MDPRRILLFIVIGLLAAYAWFRFDQRDGRRAPESFTPATAPILDPSEIKVLAALDAEYIHLVESVVPSVVSITSSRAVLQRVQPTLEDMVLGRQRAQVARSTSLGSGVIVSKEGHILTNHHVVAGMTEIRIRFTDGRNAAALLIGSDPATDIAVLRTDEPNLQPLPLANSDAIRIGQQVFAIGNPYGLEESVTRGIVSAKARRTASDSGVEFIQHDAAVNQGNSGGPLLNLRGEIIGINSQIYSTREDRGWQGISFAIPSNTARRVLENIVKRGRLIRPYLGVGMQELKPALARNFGLPDTAGALINHVEPGSPAAAGGLQPGDVVRTFNGKRIPDPRALGIAIANADIGAPAKLGIYRAGQELQITVTPIEAPAPTLRTPLAP